MNFSRVLSVPLQVSSSSSRKRQHMSEQDFMVESIELQKKKIALLTTQIDLKRRELEIKERKLQLKEQKYGM